MTQGNDAPHGFNVSGGGRPDRHETIPSRPKTPVQNSGGGNGEGGGGKDSCLSLRFSTRLVSPVPNVVGKMRHGDRVDLTLVDDTVVEVMHKGQVAGRLIGFNANQLVECMKKGHDFKGEVTLIAGADVQISVEAVR